MRILLTNDDGYMAPGIRALYTALAEAGHEVVMVAPESERSGVSLSITMTDILRAWPIELEGVNGWRTNGTPADCVKLGIRELMDEKPDLVISGINQGTNAGLNANYSGTVAGAVEASMYGLPGVAVSLDSFVSRDYRAASAVAVEVVDRLAKDPASLPPMHILSINVPEGTPEQLKGVRVTPASHIAYRELVDRRKDHRGRDYYWLGGQLEQLHPNGRGDHEFVQEGYATITPLSVDWTSKELVEKLRGLGWERDSAGDRG